MEFQDFGHLGFKVGGKLTRWWGRILVGGVEILVDVERRLGNYRCWKMTTCKELLAIRRRRT